MMRKNLLILVIIAALYDSTLTAKESESGSSESHEEQDDDGKRYILKCPPNKPTFFEAFRSCMDAYQTLATDESYEDSKKLSKLLIKKEHQEPVWLAGTDLGQSGHWMWLSVMLPVGGVSNYLRWKENQPNSKGNPPANCMVAELVEKHVKWSSKSCSATACYVCQSFGESDSRSDNAGEIP